MASSSRPRVSGDANVSNAATAAPLRIAVTRELSPELKNFYCMLDAIADGAGCLTAVQSIVKKYQRDKGFACLLDAKDDAENDINSIIIALAVSNIKNGKEIGETALNLAQSGNISVTNLALIQKGYEFAFKNRHNPLKRSFATSEKVTENDKFVGTQINKKMVDARIIRQYRNDKTQTRGLKIFRLDDSTHLGRFLRHFPDYETIAQSLILSTRQQARPFVSLPSDRTQLSSTTGRGRKR